MKQALFSFLRTRIRGAAWPQKWQLPKQQAHRGYHLGDEKENSLGSLIAAARQGSEMCEFDVRLTKDRVPVLFHDPDLFRVTGREGLLHEITYRELKEFFPVTSLVDVLRHSRVPKYLNIELKSEEIWNDPMERKVSEDVKRTRSEGRVLFSSFNPVSLFKLSSLLPSVPRALLVASDLKNPFLREMALAPLLSLHALHLEDLMLPHPEILHDWQSRGLKVAAWTVNEPEAIEKFWSWGIDSVISDLPPQKKKA